jgi:hypothetical protein
MKKSILIASLLGAVLFAMPAHAESAPLTLLINGNEANNAFNLSLSPDGRAYVITSTLMLEVGGDVCSHPEGAQNVLECNAPAIAGFEIKTFEGSDRVTLSSEILVPATIRGGPGDDRLLGGSAADKISGGSGNDLLGGRVGNDWLIGGPGNDRLLGGPGNDQLQGGPGEDELVGGPGENALAQ